MVGRVSVLNSAELRATVFAIKAAPAEIRQSVRAETRTTGAGIWRDSLMHQSSTPMQRALIVNTSRVTVSDQSIRVRAATSKRKATRGGAVPFRDGKAYEFGTDRQKVARYRTRGQGTVRRHTNRAMPAKRRSGYVFYPAVADAAPRILALWVQTTVKVISDALDGKR